MLKILRHALDRQGLLYHCSGAKGKCPEPYTREEIFEERFAELLKRLSLDDEILGWVTEALRQSHGDEKRHHDEAISRLQAEYKRLQARIDTTYEDKLDGKIDAAFFDRKAMNGEVSRTGFFSPSRNTKGRIRFTWTRASAFSNSPAVPMTSLKSRNPAKNVVFSTFYYRTAPGRMES